MAKNDTTSGINNVALDPLLPPEDQINPAMQQQFKLAWDAYSGKLPKPLRIPRGKPDDNVRVNPSRLVVDKGVAFLFGQNISFQLDGDDQQTTPPEEWLAECWEANHKATLLQKLATNGAIYGHAFILIVPQPQPGQYPRLVVLDPTTVDVKTSPHDIEQVVQYKIQYKTDPNTLFRKLITRSADGQSWQITEATKQLSDATSDWQTTAQMDWPYAWPPVVDCQNIISTNNYWGTPDLTEDLIALNNAMNFNLSNQARIIRYHAHPKQWGKGFQASELKQGIDEMLVVPAGGDLGLLQIDASSLQPSQDNYRVLKEAYHEIANVPEIATGKVENVGQLSGVALAILYQPIIERTNKKRLTYGDMLKELCLRLLELGQQSTAGSKLTITWPELLPRDMLVERQALAADQAMGIVSRETLATKLGYNFELEQERMANEALEVKEAQTEAAQEETQETPEEEALEEGENDKDDQPGAGKTKNTNTKKR